MIEKGVVHEGRAARIVRSGLLAAAVFVVGTAGAQDRGTSAADSITPAPRVAVTDNASAPEPDATAAEGYRPKKAETTGPWGQRGIEDTPYSINVVGSELIDNTVTSTVDQIFARSPSVQLNLGQAAGYGSIIYIRGLRMDSLGSGFTQVDGKRVTGDLIMPVEDKERVEVLSGLSGFLYGSGNVGGLVNYVLKRPTANPLVDLSVGNYGGGQYFVHGDFGGPIDKDGRFGYRLNVVGSEGDTAVDFNHVTKWLLSGAFDWHVNDNILARVNYSHQHYHETATGGGWGTFGGSFPHFSPDLLDPAKNYGQTWAYNRNDMDTGGFDLDINITAALKLRTSYQKVVIRDEQVYTGNNVSFDGSTYTYDLAAVRRSPLHHSNDTGYAFLDYSLATGPVTQKLTAGFFGDSYKLRIHQDDFEFLDLGVFNVSSQPQYVTAPTFDNGTLPFYTSQKTSDRNWVIGDDIHLGEAWSALLGVTRGTIDTENFNTDGSTSSHYEKSVTSPSVSLLYRVIRPVTLYATYIKSLEGSGTASDTFNGSPVVNANQSLQPTVSRQYELGAKVDAGGSLLTASLFDIHRSNTYYASSDGGQSFVYTNDGEVHVKGLEITTTGRVTSNITVVAGLDLLDPRVTRTNDDYLRDQTPYGAARRMAKLYAEYDVPFAPGLTLTGGGNYVGGQLANAYAYPDPLGRDFLPSFTTWDVGARYLLKLRGTDVIARLFVNNVTNEAYWEQTGAIGAPRSIAFSVAAKLR